MSRPLGTLVDIGGRRLHYVARGFGTPTVVFESGGGGGSSIQDLPILRLVSAFTRAFVYDRAGYGWSDAAFDGRSFEDLASDCRTLLTHAGEAPPYVVVGSSFGGLIGRTFCRLYPEDVAGMVLVDAAEEGQYFATMPGMRSEHERELREEMRRAESGELRETLEGGLLRARHFTEAEKAAVLNLVARSSHHKNALKEMAAIDLTPQDRRPAGGFGSLGSRPLVVLGHGKPFTGQMSPWEEGFGEAQRRLVALSTNSAHVIAAQCAHSIGLEHPMLVAECIRAVVNATKGSVLDVGEPLRLARERG